MSAVPEEIRAAEKAADELVKAMSAPRQQPDVTEPDANEATPDQASEPVEIPATKGRVVCGVSDDDPKWNDAAYWRNLTSTTSGRLRVSREEVATLKEASNNPQVDAGHRIEIAAKDREIAALAKDLQEARTAVSEKQRVDQEADRESLRERLGPEVVENFDRLYGRPAVAQEPTPTPAQNPEQQHEAFLSAVNKSLAAKQLPDAHVILNSPEFVAYADSLVEMPGGGYEQRGTEFLRARDAQDASAVTSALEKFFQYLSGQKVADKASDSEPRPKRDVMPESVTEPPTERAEMIYTRAHAANFYAQKEEMARRPGKGQVFRHPVTGAVLSDQQVDQLESDILAANSTGRLRG